jgi:squalene-associated FAD-dependent desaturase
VSADDPVAARGSAMGRPTLAVIGAGWAGLATAVAATRRGHQVTLYEMAAHLGGRARAVPDADWPLDNGQHILIGAYQRTLALMREVGVEETSVLLRRPLCMTDPTGAGLRLRKGPAVPAFVGAVLRQSDWRVTDKLSLLWQASVWALRRFRCDAPLSVAQLTRGLGPRVRRELIEPLCVAALNTPADQASGQVFLRVLHDALFSGPGASDLLLPRVDLSQLLPHRAQAWLNQAGATLRLNHRAMSVVAEGGGWQVDGERFDQVVLATPPGEAARLAGPTAPPWTTCAHALRYEPIVTVYLFSEGARLPEPMLLLHADDRSPGQFVFDRGQLGGPAGLLALVISGAQPWVDQGTDAIEAAATAQALRHLGEWLKGSIAVVRTLTEKRATFACTPGMVRPPRAIAPGLQAAGDYVAGPYPATLEGAVLAGLAAADAL